MVIDIIMPKLGESIVEGVVARWHVSLGQRVKKDQPICDISTDKVDSEIPSPEDGTLVAVLASEGVRIDVGSVLGRLETAAVAHADAGVVTDPPVGNTPAKRFVSPVVKELARRHGLSENQLDAIAGTGFGGRVKKIDINKALAMLPMREEALVPATALGRTGTTVPGPSEALTNDGIEQVDVRKLDMLGAKMASHMRQSVDRNAHAWSLFEMNVGPVLDAVDRIRPRVLQDQGFKLTLTHAVAFCVVRALSKAGNEKLVSTLDRDEVVRYRGVNLGLAVASPKGLVVPVVHQAQDLSFLALARSIHRLSQSARNNGLRLEDISGSTFTITNYGVFGQEIGIPIINLPNSAILGVGAVTKRPIVVESPAGDAIGIGRMAWFSLGFDHRLIDGETAALFLASLRESLRSFDAQA